MKIYLLMCQDVDVMEDYPVKFFTDSSIADSWCDNYNKQYEEYFSDEFEEGDELPIFYYVEESEIEQGLNFDVLF